MNILNKTLPMVVVAEGRVCVTFPTGVQLSFPVVGNERLRCGTEEQLGKVEVDEEGLRWPELDEDLSFEGLVKGDYGQRVRHLDVAR